MNDENNIFIHLKTLSGQENETGWPYSVSFDYFHLFAQKLPDRISDDANLPDILLNASKTVPYSLPDNCFVGTENKTAYTVPHNYFDEINCKIAAKIPAESKTSVRKIQKKWWQMAAAAIIIGIITLASFQIFSLNQSEKRDNAAVNFAQQKIQSIETDQLAGFLGTSDSIFSSQTVTSSTKSPANSVDLNQLLKKISDKDLKKFLDETGDENDDFLLN